MKVIKVGRGYENDEVLNDSTVSRNHLEIFFGDDRLVVVTDLNSANGTTVNGKKINEPTKLDSLDILKAGNSLINWKNYLKDNNDSNNEISPEIKQKDDIKENDYNLEPKSKNIIQNYMKELIFLLIISFLVIILVFFKTKFKEVKESVAIIDKVENLYTNLVEPLISNFTPQKKTKDRYYI